MKNIIKILKFEYLTCVRNKAFIITTIFLMAAILLSTFIPMLILMLMDSSNEGSDGEKPVIGISCTVYDKELVKSELQNIYNNYELKMTDEDLESIKENVSSGKYDFAIVIDTKLSFKYITANNSLYDSETDYISDAVKSIYTVTELEKYGIPLKAANELMNTGVQYETITTGKDQTKNYLPVYVLMIALFAAIASYGQLVAQSVVSEKNTRAMELLITCAKPTHLMFGKVTGAGLAGLTQLALVLLTAAASFGTGSNPMIPEYIMDYIQIPVTTVVLALIFFILGYFIYAFLLGALASFASKSEDLNSLISPIIFILMAVYMAVMFMMTGDAVNGTAMTVLSYIPFSAPMAMLVRATLTDIAVWEICLSIAVQIISIYLLGMLAAAIYKIGVLMYGNPPKPGEIIKMLGMQRKANKTAKK